jgi:hypothetical protein
LYNSQLQNFFHIEVRASDGIVNLAEDVLHFGAKFLPQVLEVITRLDTWLRMTDATDVVVVHPDDAEKQGFMIVLIVVRTIKRGCDTLCK